MPRKTFADIIKNWNDEQRIGLAKKHTERLTHHVANCLRLHETRRIYSNTLSKQIPHSYAAHAFNVVQGALHGYKLICLRALWDKPSKETESIPTVIELIDKPDIKTASFWNNQSAVLIARWFNATQKSYGITASLVLASARDYKRNRSW